MERERDMEEEREILGGRDAKPTTRMHIVHFFLLQGFQLPRSHTKELTRLF